MNDYKIIALLLFAGLLFYTWLLYALFTAAHPPTSDSLLQMHLALSEEPRLQTAVAGSAKRPPSNPLPGAFGEDAWFASPHAIGVADGVGMWSQMGIDAGKFSRFLMDACGQIARQRRDPVELLSLAYESLLRQEPPIRGSCTACVLTLDALQVRVANLGDSGFRAFRRVGDATKLLHKSEEQQHTFNNPYQLSNAPPHFATTSDQPGDADVYSFRVSPGDVLLLATDGVLDNVPGELLLENVDKLFQGTGIQDAADAIAALARELSQDAERDGPFALNARKHGMSYAGGKPDDITVVLAQVV